MIFYCSFMDEINDGKISIINRDYCLRTVIIIDKQVVRG